MNKILTFFFSFLIFIFPISFVHAQGMMGRANITPTANDDVSTLQDEAKGKAIWDKLQAKQITCNALTNDDFDVLGDYFMGQMVGTSHRLMNTNMSKMMGDEGEKQMHIVMGKQYSGCTSNTSGITQNERNYSMMGGWNQRGFGNSGNMMVGNKFIFVGMHIAGLITWIFGLVFLTLGSMYFWKQINRKDKK